jgi:6-phosphogluconolactonase
VAADLGLDKLLVYRFDKDSGKLTPNDPPASNVAPGAGPRHFAFHPSGRYAYVINEMNLTVTAFQYDGNSGRLDDFQTISTVPEGISRDGLSTAEVRVHPSGKFLYGSNRGHNSIAIFSIGEDGRLTATGHVPTGGRTPRNFVIDPSGSYLFAENQQSGTIVLFKINLETGGLETTGTVLNVPNPVCIRFIPIES